MTPEAKPWERELLGSLKRSYEAQGFEFHVKPTGALVPPFLADHIPDAIAIDRSGVGGVIVELVRQGGLPPDVPLAELSRRVAAQKGWEFRAFPVSSGPEQAHPIPRPTREQIKARLDEIETLAHAGHLAPALILGWAVLESLARLARPEGSASRYSPIQAVQALAEEGYLEHECAQGLRDLAKLRNSIVHGDFSVDVSAEDVDFLFRQLNALNLALSELAEDSTYAN